MLAQLSSVKARLGLSDIDLTHDPLLTGALHAVSARFDRYCRRTFARTVDALYEFPADETEIRVPGYPVESLTRWELKPSEAAGWAECAGVECLLRTGGVISLARPLGSWRQQGRLVYTGGYCLPGTAPGPGQTPLPPDLEHAAVEQVAWWFNNRDRLGLSRIWDYHATYRHFEELELLRPVLAILDDHRRWG